jgi:hypothetical protein
MGCDIHAVIEYEQFNNGFAHAFTEGLLQIPRDYELFSAIAFGDGGITDDLPYPPRGLPHNFSQTVRELFFVEADALREAGDDVDDEEKFDPEEEAAYWGDWAVKEFRENGNLPAYEQHTPGWLNFDELVEALAHAQIKTEELSPEFRAVLAAMHTLSEAYGAEKVRLVFWFDG